MKRVLLLILCVALLVGCRQTPTPPASGVELVRAVAIVGGKEYVLYPASTGGIRLPSIDGEVVFEYSGPVEVDADSSIIAVSGSTVRTILIGSSQVAHTPGNIRDKHGRPLKKHEFYLTRIAIRPVRAFWVSGNLEEELQVMDGPRTLMMVGEVIKLEFSDEPHQATMEEQLVAGLGTGIKYKFTWPDRKTLLFELSATNEEEFVLRFDETTYWGFYVVGPQKLSSLDRERRILSTIDIPISATSAIALTSDFRHVRLVRRVNLAWLHIGTQEYLLDLETGNIQRGKLHSRAVHYADEILLDWIDKTHAASKTELRSPAGLSNKGDRLALYEDGMIKLIEFSTRKTRTIVVQSRAESEGNFPHPRRIFWSHDDKHLYYTAVPSSDQVYWLHRLDIASETEIALLRGHYVRSTSPHGPHVFTEVWVESGAACYMIDGAGKATRLSEPSEYVGVTKWLDATKVLINKSAAPSRGTPASMKCYIYYPDANRWEYISEGFGIDYDLSTGRVFVLQNR